MATSFLIASIDSVLRQLASMRINSHFPVRQMKVGLRNLNTLFLLFKSLGNSGNLDAVDLTMLKETVARTAPLRRKLQELLALLKSFDDEAIRLKTAWDDWAKANGKQQFLDSGDDAKKWFKLHLEDPIMLVVGVIVGEAYRLCAELDDKWQVKMSSSNPSGQSCGLTAGEVVGFAASILDNVADFVALASMSRSLNSIQLKVEAIDAFEVQVKFLKDFLLFAIGSGVGHKQLQSLLICVQPFAMDATRAFILQSLDWTHKRWIEQVQAKCLTLSAMAVNPQVYEAYTRALTTSKPAIHMDRDSMSIMKSFVDSLISLLWDILRGGSGFRKDDQQDVLLYERLRVFRTILKQPPQSFEDGNEIGGLICDAGILICLLHQRDADASDPGRGWKLLQRFDAFQAEHEIIVPEEKELSVGDVTNIMEDVNISDKVQKVIAATSHQPRVSHPQAKFKDDELSLILNRLTRGTSKHLQKVLISGMAGIGKTTFALAVYNHDSVKYHFQAKARCSVSQKPDKKKVLLQLLSQTQREGYSSQMTEDDLANKLRQSLKGKRYLIFLDDVWTPEAWNNLSQSFPDDNMDSRIILTSRYGDLFPHEKPHLIRLRDDDECLHILEMKLSDEQNMKFWTPEFGMKVAKLCKGLPLTAVVAAGFLATTAGEGWEGIFNAFNAGSLSIAEQCYTVLELSYKHLPDDLKSCFLYLGAFPEDEKVLARRLTRLWMAEGFVKEDESKRIEDAARECLEHLIERSLVMVAQNSITGGVKSCQIHDLLHEFCRTKAKQTGFFHLLQGHEQLSDMKDSCSLQRLCIHSELIQFKKAKLFCPQAHSLMFFTSEDQVWSFTCLFDMLFIVQIFKGVKVLDIENVLLSSGIPSEIDRLTQLTYLSAGSEVDAIPSSLGNLSCLETFIMEFPSASNDDPISLPPSLWNLHELKYLEMRCSKRSLLPLENLKGSSILSKLETLRGVIFLCDGSMETLMSKFPNIRRLKCVVVPAKFGSLEKIVVPDIVKQLQSLTILARGNRYQLDFGSSENLKMMTLQDFHLSAEEIAVLGKLPNLEFLKLVEIRFVQGTLEMDEGEFSSLRYLQLRDAFCRSLKSWTVSDDLPFLEKLVLENCKKLEEMPGSDNFPVLEEIELYNCSPIVESFVRDIKEQLEDGGNLAKVHIEVREDISRGLIEG